jgi:zinc metalloprotease ZmpB
MDGAGARSYGVTCCLLVVSLLGASPSEAQQRTRPAAPSPITIRVADGRAATSATGGLVPRAAYRLSVDTRGKEPAAALAQRFGWQPGDLELLERVNLGGSSHVVYQQTHEGLPVLNRFVRVSLNASGYATMVVSGYEPGLDYRGFSSRPDLPPAKATTVAIAAVGGDSHAAEPELVIVPGAVPVLAWRVVVWPLDVMAEIEVLIDARTAAVLSQWDMTVRRRDGSAPRTGSGQTGIRMGSTGGSDGEAAKSASARPASRRLDATGLVFDPDPLATSGSDYVPPYVDGDDATNAALDAEMKSVTLRDVTLGSDGLVRLEGPYLTIVGRNSGGLDVYSPPAEAGGSFAYNRSLPGFEAVNVYYHIDSSQRYVQSLGILDLQSSSPIQVNPSGTTGDDSGWLASQRFLFFGTGGVDDGEDVAVVLHEYAHALLEGGAPGLRTTLEGQALHEGWADYWAMSYQRGLIDSGEMARSDWEQVFRWDSGLGEIWAGRRLDFQGHYPEDTCSDSGPGGACSVHNDGRLWGTVLMAVFDDLGKEVTDRLNLLSHRYLVSGATFADAAEAVVQADVDHYGGVHVETLISHFGPRGLVDPAEFGPILIHEGLSSTEQTGGTRPVVVRAIGVGSAVAAVSIEYRYGAGSFSSVPLTLISGDSFQGSLPLSAAPGVVEYFIRAVDTESRETLRPSGAPVTLYSFTTGPDSEDPVIVHTPIAETSLAQWPPTVSATVVDNLGVDWVQASYVVNVPGEAAVSGSVFLEREENSWSARFDLPVSDVAVGTEVSYEIEAQDISVANNRSVSGPHTFQVSGTGVLRAYSPGSSGSNLDLSGLFAAAAPSFGTRVSRTGSVWGTLPAASYPPAAGVSTLELHPLNLTDTGAPKLVFWHWYDTEHDGRADPAATGGDILWDGGNVKLSVDGGATWSVLLPAGGYSGTIISGPDNQLSAEAAFGGFSYGWRRETMPLPASKDVRIRFDFGTDATNTESAREFAGWLIDDIQIINQLGGGSALPALAQEPPATTTAPSGVNLPELSIGVLDDVGVSDAWLEYDFTSRTGTVSGSARMTQSEASLSQFAGAIELQATTQPGDQIIWRVRLKDVDGNETLTPPTNAAGYVINIRLASFVSLMDNASGSGGWTRVGSDWQTAGEELGSLVMAPLNVAQNQTLAVLEFEHGYHFGQDAGGQIELSQDDGASWALADPVGGYPGEVDGAGAFVGTGSARAERVDLSLLGGVSVRLRLSIVGETQASDSWRVGSLFFQQETTGDEFELPAETVLHANFPDPFGYSTNISYSLPLEAPVVMTLHDMLGRRVAVVDEGIRRAGTHTAVLEAGNLASGVYLLRLDTGTAVKFEMLTVAR